MMTIVEKVNALKEKVGNRLFNEKDCEGITTIRTLKKYGYIEKAEEENLTECSLEDLVEELNGMIGQDCYEPYEEGYYYNYEVRNNKAYLVQHYIGYRFVK